MDTHSLDSKNDLSRFSWWLWVLLSLLTTASVAQTQSIPLASWADYSDSEKAALKSRWTPEQVDAVVAALAGGKVLPEFVAKVPPAGGGMVFVDDLRGISLNGADSRRDVKPRVGLTYVTQRENEKILDNLWRFWYY